MHCPKTQEDRKKASMYYIGFFKAHSLVLVYSVIIQFAFNVRACPLHLFNWFGAGHLSDIIVTLSMRHSGIIA